MSIDVEWEIVVWRERDSLCVLGYRYVEELVVCRGEVRCGLWRLGCTCEEMFVCVEPEFCESREADCWRVRRHVGVVEREMRGHVWYTGGVGGRDGLVDCVCGQKGVCVCVETGV